MEASDGLVMSKELAVVLSSGSYRLCS